jgi:hypothetical protein
MMAIARPDRKVISSLSPFMPCAKHVSHLGTATAEAVELAERAMVVVDAQPGAGEPEKRK